VVMVAGAACAAGCGSGSSGHPPPGGAGGGGGIGGSAGAGAVGGRATGGTTVGGASGSGGLGAAGHAGTGGLAGNGVGGGAGGAMGGAPGGGAGGAAGSAGGAAGTPLPCDKSPDIDVPAVAVTGTITFNGATVPFQTGSGTVVAQSATSGSATILWSSGPPIGPATPQMIIPGAYDLYYSGGGATDATVPVTASPVLRTVVFPATGLTTLTVDVPVVTVGGAITYGGIRWDTSSDYGRVYLQNASGLTTTLNSMSDNYLLGIVPGVYDVLYSLDGGSSPGTGTDRVPYNLQALVKQGVSIPGPGAPVTLDVDVPVTTVSGKVTINGATDTGVVPLQLADLRTNGVGTAPLSRSPTGVTQYAAPLIPGTYDLYTNGAGHPSNFHGLIRKGVVISPSTTALDIDITAGKIAGTVTVGGAVAGTSSDYGQIVLVNDATDDWAVIAATYQGTSSASVLPGTYDVYYRVETYSLQLPKASPRNTNAKIGSVTVAATGTTTANIDVPLATVKGNLTINGATRKTSDSAGGLFLVGPNRDEAELGTTTGSSYTALVVPGTYDLYYRSLQQAGLTGASTAPRNTHARLRSGIVVAAGGTTQLDIDIPTITVTGAMTIGGAPAPNEQESGDLWLSTSDGDYVDLGSTSPTSYTVTLVPGRFDVNYKLNSGGAVAPLNSFARLRCLDATP
jgi:hypothetical protein